MIENSLLWKVENHSFLFGTMHIYNTDLFRLPSILFKLIDSVDIYSPETDNTVINSNQMLPTITVDDSDYNLQNYFNDNEYLKILDIANADSNDIKNYKPFFVIPLIFAQTMPPDSIDKELLSYAYAKNKTICEIESFEEQINAIDKLTFEAQADLVKNTLLQIEQNNFDEMMLDYKNQDMEALKRSLKDANPNELFINNIQKDRNITMANKIESIINEARSAFFAFGALHLPDTENAQGIITILRNKGYKIESIPFSFEN